MLRLFYKIFVAGQKGLDTVYCSHEGNILHHNRAGLSCTISYPNSVSFFALPGTPQGQNFACYHVLVVTEICDRACNNQPSEHKKLLIFHLCSIIP